MQTDRESFHIARSMPKVLIKRLMFIIMSVLVSSCFYQGPYTSDAWSMTEEQLDSISFYTTHHYTRNFNFSVRSDSLLLIAQHPTEFINGLQVDSLYIRNSDKIVVADFATISNDSIDTLWVRVARDEETIGWIHENDLLNGVSPDTPIAQFIDIFPNTHLLVFVCILILALALLMFRRIKRLGSKIVYFNDIDSFYPTFLCLLIATSAVFYSSIQMFAPETWRHFYYHPTLNPFSVPLHIGLFLTSVWGLLISLIATLDDVRRHLAGWELISYLLGLAAVCGLLYIIFSITTLYYIGYLLYLALLTVCLRKYLFHTQVKYLCGNCGKCMPSKGICPHCGAMND